MKPEDIPLFYALDDTQAGILTVYGEARGESLEGKQAVCCVIANRAEKWNKSIKDICFAKNQFSCYISSDPNYQKLLSIAEHFEQALALDKALAECAKAWHDDCKDIEAKIDGATFYKVTGTRNGWFDRQIDTGKLIRTAGVGHHEFFKEA